MIRFPNGRRTGARPGVRLLLAAGALLLALAAPQAASAVPQLDLVVVGSELEKSFIQINNGSKVSFPGATSYDVDLDVVAGTVSLEDFTLPSFFGGFDLSFALSYVPDVVDGVFAVLEGGLSADLVFPSVTVDFIRDSVYHGSLTFDLTTQSAVVPAGCAGRATDQVIEGSPLDFLTGEVMLVGAVCPQVAYFQGNPELEQEFNEAFRVILRGTITDLPAAVPEPGTFMLVGAGLGGLAVAGRRRRGEARKA